MTLTPEKLDELKRKHETGQPEMIELNHGVRLPCTFQQAEREANRMRCGLALYDAFPALEQLARFGLMAKAFCEEHGETLWLSLEAMPTGHARMERALKELLAAARGGGT